LREDRDNYILRKMKESALEEQIGGTHYKNCEIQPVEYIVKNGLDFLEGNIIKYTTRHRKKGQGKEDIEKVIHYANMILHFYYEGKNDL
tara:strand:- start:224 stop:490 length:267 start_codon:yes stop_codon:yes gene_type:complete